MSGRPLVRVAGASVLLLTLYYVLPVEGGDADWRLVLRVASSAICVIGATVLIVRQVRKQMNPALDEPPLAGLAVALVAGLVAFAMADYLIAVSDPSAFVGLRTRTDALYFALSTLLTVGYGDVHAEGQPARVLVILQMGFNIVVLATGASFLGRQISDRARRPRTPAAAAAGAAAGAAAASRTTPPPETPGPTG